MSGNKKTSHTNTLVCEAIATICLFLSFTLASPNVELRLSLISSFAVFRSVALRLEIQTIEQKISR